MSAVDETAFYSTMSGSFKPGEWRSASGKGVTVAIIDSGIDVRHPDLTFKVIESVEARFENKKVVFDPSTAGDSAAFTSVNFFGCGEPVVDVVLDGGQCATQGWRCLGLPGGEQWGQDAVVDFGVEDRER